MVGTTVLLPFLFINCMVLLGRRLRVYGEVIFLLWSTISSKLQFSELNKLLEYKQTEALAFAFGLIVF